MMERDNMKTVLWTGMFWIMFVKLTYGLNKQGGKEKMEEKF